MELNLEDAFIEYTRGPMWSLPLAAGQPTHERAAAGHGGIS